MSKKNSYQNLYPNLFSPITIKGHYFKNRIVAAPNSGGPNLFMASGYEDCSTFTETAVQYYAGAARGGAGVVNTGHLGVDPRFTLGANRERFDFFSENLHHHVLPVMHMMTDLIHSYGAKASIELNHPGYRGTSVYGDKLLGPCDDVLKDGREVVAMDEEEMIRVADYFANAALVGKRGGFDIVNIHAGHGWLISNFVSPLFNKRTDEYGGSAENRSKFPLMIIKRIREAVGDDMLINFRFSVNEIAKGGNTIEESIKIIKILEEYADLVHCSAGSVNDFLSMAFMFGSQFSNHGSEAYLAKEVRKHVNLKVETVAGINEPEMAETFIANGTADFVAMSRSFIADPNWANKAQEGRPEDIRPCIRCLRCLEYADKHTGTSECTVNPRRILPRPMPQFETETVLKKVVVVGGGPAGMQAAYELGKKGHEVVLFEKSNKLGGALKFADHVKFKYDLKRYRDYLITQVEKLKNVTVKLGIETTPDIVRSENPDAVVIAIGAKPFIPPVRGVDNDIVMHSSDVFGNENIVGNKVVIIGGGNVGCETTAHLQSLGKTVDLVEMDSKLIPDSHGLDMERGFTVFFCKREINMDMKTYEDVKLSELVNIHVSTKCLEVTDSGVWVEKNGDKLFIEADTVIMATGLKADVEIREVYNNIAQDVIAIGDCFKVGDIFNTSRTGYYASHRI